MTKTCVSLTTRFRGTRSDRNRLPATRRYRIRKSFPVVHFEQNGKGRIVFLPEGEELYVIGFSSHLREGFEVTCRRQLYNIFQTDLLGPWSDPIEPSEIQTTTRSTTVRAIPAMGAGA